LIKKILSNREIKQEIIDWCYLVFGSVMFVLALNIVITPLGLYNGGFMGITQLIALFVTNVLHINLPASINVTGILYFFINIPLWFLGLKVFGKKFSIKTLVTIIIQSGLLAIVPIPKVPILDDYLLACIIGGALAGTGTGLVLRGRSSGGGMDIVGLYATVKWPGLSVGKIGIIVNVIVYGICMFLFNIEIVIYSIVYAFVTALATDRVHIQNINVSIMIFTKKRGISKAIMEETGRGVTNWDGMGAYTEKTSYVLFTMASKYEIPQIKRIVRDIDPDAFVIINEGAQVDGNFMKKLQ
jgi:uncharacterized membrane-anchored protein YitT (DUF2179 family)